MMNNRNKLLMEAANAYAIFLMEANIRKDRECEVSASSA
jgi:hypothetical protein